MKAIKTEPVLSVYRLRVQKHHQIVVFAKLVFGAVIGLVLGALAAQAWSTEALTTAHLTGLGMLVLSTLLLLQSIGTLVWMLYAWEDPKEVKKHQSPRVYKFPEKSFTALIPTRHEEQVIADTIKAVNNIRYPDTLKETIILCRDDDEKTIEAAQNTIESLGKRNIILKVFSSFPINKPHALNRGLEIAKNEIIAVFDAEDEPHPDIYNIVNTAMTRGKVDAVQSGVQLMNFRSNWFSALNCLEYYFWFKSGLHFFSKVGQITPLGGNTVFIKKDCLNTVNGWDETCLTEDADIGFRLVRSGAKIKVIYDENHVTREETPAKAKGFIKQRTRWNQGFLQILTKNSWSSLPRKRQKIIALYILLSPIMQALMLAYIPIALWMSLTTKMPVLISLFSFLPFLVLGLQITTLCIGLHEFTKSYNMKFPCFMPLKIVFTFFPYQMLLMIASLRATYRFFFNLNSWEKTLHLNAHRDMSYFKVAHVR